MSIYWSHRLKRYRSKRPMTNRWLSSLVLKLENNYVLNERSVNTARETGLIFSENDTDTAVEERSVQLKTVLAVTVGRRLSLYAVAIGRYILVWTGRILAYNDIVSPDSDVYCAWQKLTVLSVADNWCVFSKHSSRQHPMMGTLRYCIVALVGRPLSQTRHLS